jgi:DNA polymerase
MKMFETRKEAKKQAMESLGNQINACKKCDLWKTRNKPLVGDGSVGAGILVVGESPGYYEDLKGKAFVGEAGRVLDILLDLTGLGRKDIYITNVLKCHPPRNHNPNRQEIDACIGYLHSQIEIIKPRIILTLGKFASKEIFEKFNLRFSRISELHGKVFDAKTSFGNIKIIPLYHPAVACYHDEMLDVLKKDFLKLKKEVKK